MKKLSIILLAAVAGLSPVLTGCGDKKQQSAEAAFPYPLDTCLVSGEKIGGKPDMEPYTFVYEGREIKLCCKDCLKDFNKEPEKYLAKLPPPVVPNQ